MSRAYVTEVSVTSDDRSLAATITVVRRQDGLVGPTPRPSDVPPDIRAALADWLESGR